MAGLQELERALVGAHNAGDVAAAKTLARAILEARGTQEKPKEQPKFPVEKFDAPSDFDNAAAGIGKSVVDPVRGIGQMLGINSQAEIDEAKRLDAPLMDTKAGLAGNIAGNVGLALAPGGALAKVLGVGANTVKGSAIIGGALAAAQPVTGASDADFWKKKGIETAQGAGLGALGAGVAKGVGWAKGKAGEKAAALVERVKAKAAADAAAETATARSYAGNAAQNAYKQMQVLAAKAEQGALSPDEAMVWKSLQEEYLRKAQEKLIPAAAAKEVSAKAFKEAIDTEADRAAMLAAERLSGKEAKNQVMARLKRYGPAAIGGAIGGTMFGGAGAVAGVPIGLYLRPALHATMRMAKNPAVQYQMLRPLAAQGLLGDFVTDPRLMGLLGPSIYAAQQ